MVIRRPSRVPSKTTRPSLISTRRSASLLTSVMSWVVNSTERPRCSTWNFRNSRTCSFTTTSIPIVGSSRKTIIGIVQQRGGEVRPHALPRDSCRTGCSRRREPQQVIELPERARNRSRHLEDVAEDRRAIPGPADPTRVGFAARRPLRCSWRCGCDLDVARCRPPHAPRRRHENAGEHLDGRGLPGTVRAEQGQHLALPHRQGDVVDGYLGDPAWRQHGGDSTDEAGSTHHSVEGLREIDCGYRLLALPPRHRSSPGDLPFGHRVAFINPPVPRVRRQHQSTGQDSAGPAARWELSVGVQVQKGRLGDGRVEVELRRTARATAAVPGSSGVPPGSWKHSCPRRGTHSALLLPSGPRRRPPGDRRSRRVRRSRQWQPCRVRAVG